MKTLAAYVALALASAQLMSCAGDSALALAPNSNEPCTASTECLSGYTCQGSQCRLNNDNPDDLDMLISPPLSSEYVDTQLLHQRVSADQQLDLVLPRPSEHSVLVYDDAFDPPHPIDVRISFVGSEDRIAGQEVDLATEIRTMNPRTRDVRLLQGEYDVSITRLDTAPGLRTHFSVREPTDLPVTKEFHFKLGRHIRGEVTSAVSTATKLEGIKVIAYSIETGFASTTTVTGKNGVYEVELPNTTDTAFRLVAVAPDEVQPAWGYEETVTIENRDDAVRMKDIPLEPTSDILQGTAMIQFGAEGPEGFVPAKRANVTLTAISEGGVSTRSYRVKGVTNDQGYLEIRDATGFHAPELLKGMYTAEVATPPESEVARASATDLSAIDLSAVGPNVTPNVQVPLSLRAKVRGEVRSDLGRPVPFAEVDLVSADVEALAFRAKTDADGSFSTWADPGAYVLVVSPTSQTDVNEMVPISARELDVYAVPEQDLGTISMPGAATVYGRVRGMIDLAGLANSKVELFQELRGRAVTVGEAFSDLDGTFSIIVSR